MGTTHTVRMLVSILLIPIGAVLVLIAGTGKVGVLVNGLGMSLMVAGVVAAFRELMIVRLEAEEMAEKVAANLGRQLPHNGGGAIRLVGKVRRGYEGYYRWAISKEPCDLFCAGRSILHRVRDDFEDHGLVSVEEVLRGKLQQGSTIRFLFLDPRSDLIARLSKEEGQTTEAMLADLAISLGICKRLYQLIGKSKLPPHAELHIRVYDEVPYFAYHRQDDNVVVGFYFVSALGSASAAYEVVDPATRGFFEGHFTSIFDRATADGRILELAPHRGAPDFNTELFDKLRAVLETELGKDRCEHLLAG